MSSCTRTRLRLRIQRIAWRYLPTSRQVEALWNNWLGWAVVLGIAAGTVLGVVVVCWRYGP